MNIIWVRESPCVLNSFRYQLLFQVITDSHIWMVSELGTYSKIHYYLTHIQLGRNLPVTNFTLNA